MFDVVIVGAGPRGLAVALECLKNNLQFTIVDPYPLKTWRELGWYSFQMRSPLSFDLVDNPNSEYSLKSFINKKYPEATEDFIYRDQFTEYLESILEIVKPNLIEEKVTAIYGDHVVTNNNKIYGNKIVLAFGSLTKKQNYFYQDKIISPDKIKDKSGLNLLVIGSGQGAAEYVSYFAQNNKVTWAIKHTPRIYQYPIPDEKIWGLKDCFGSHFKKLSIKNKLLFLKQVKKWQPSITPYVYEKMLAVQNNFSYFKNRNLEDFHKLVERSDYILLALGNEFILSKFPLKISLQTLNHNPNLPLLVQGFKSSVSSIRFTGLAAGFYDGLRQGSIGSAAATAQEIISTDN